MKKTPLQIIRELTDKIKDLECALQKAKENSGYGLKREEKPEIFEERSQNALPVLKEKNDLFIDNKSDLDHLIIEGDNYHILSALSYTHKGKIDVIYIDPPYNTGNKDFVYNDSYVDPEDSYRHSKRLSFMHKRLRLAKELLSDDGVIFISIDDNEQANLKLLCDQIFGENNFVTTFHWKRSESQNNSAKQVAIVWEYVLCYAKNKDICIFNPIDLQTSALKEYRYIDEQSWKKFRRGTIVDNSRWKNIFEIISPAGLRKTIKSIRSQQFFIEKQQNDEIYRTETGTPYLKIFLDNSKGQIANNWLDKAGVNEDASEDLRNLIIDFSFSKPKSLISFLIKISERKNSIILDFFAWSGTTGHSVLELNKQDWGSRQFILCSNSEATGIEPEKNICRNITYERVKRVMQGYMNAKDEAIEGLWGGNLRYYATDFIKKEKSTDDLRQRFIYLCDELLCIKEDTFIVLNSDYCSDQLRCYYKNDHYTVILYDLWQMDKLQQLIAGVNGQVSLYLFSLSKDAYEEELFLFRDKIKIENVPDDILETYHKIF